MSPNGSSGESSGESSGSVEGPYNAMVMRPLSSWRSRTASRTAGPPIAPAAMTAPIAAPVNTAFAGIFIRHASLPRHGTANGSAGRVSAGSTYQSSGTPYSPTDTCVASRNASTAADAAGGLLRRGTISVNESKRQAFKDEVPVELTMKEFDLILFLMKNPGRVYSRENLLDLVWGYEYQGDTRTVDVHIRRLREKLERDPAHPENIITKWGVGYYLAD